MKQLLDSDESDFFIDLFDWDFNNLFEESFHQYIDATLEATLKYIDEMIPVNNQYLSNKDIKKLFVEYNKFLWQISDNRIKYCFYFNFKYFSNFISALNNLEFDFIKTQICSFKTKELIDYLSNSLIYNQFLLSISQNNKC